MKRVCFISTWRHDVGDLVRAGAPAYELGMSPAPGGYVVADYRRASLRDTFGSPMGSDARKRGFVAFASRPAPCIGVPAVFVDDADDRWLSDTAELPASDRGDHAASVTGIGRRTAARYESLLRRALAGGVTPEIGAAG